MKQENDQNQKDQEPGLPDHPELKRLLAKWPAPDPPVELDRRALASYRVHFNHKGLLRRWLTGSIRIPVPIATAAVLLICATSFLTVRKATSVSIETPPPTPLTKYVEVPVPVIQEKPVTQVVRLKQGQKTSKPDSPYPGGVATKAARRDLADFRPVDEINIVVISEETIYEK